MRISSVSIVTKNNAEAFAQGILREENIRGKPDEIHFSTTIDNSGFVLYSALLVWYVK